MELYLVKDKCKNEHSDEANVHASACVTVCRVELVRDLSDGDAVGFWVKHDFVAIRSDNHDIFLAVEIRLDLLAAQSEELKKIGLSI